MIFTKLKIQFFELFGMGGFGWKLFQPSIFLNLFLTNEKSIFRFFYIKKNVLQSS